MYINAVYDLANTYLGDLSDDILGEVYERQLARVDRKQLGQYYTPRDIIKVIWDLIDIDRIADAAEDEERPIRILDIATGSGGFLVAASSRLRGRYLRARDAGATVDAKAWLADVTDGLIGCEIQQFSAYLAEVNVILQLSSILRSEKQLRLPALRIHCADTLTLHNPDNTALIGAMETVKVDDRSGVQTAAEIAERQESLDRLRDPYLSGDWLDVAVGNPPYVGEKVNRHDARGSACPTSLLEAVLSDPSGLSVLLPDPWRVEVASWGAIWLHYDRVLAYESWRCTDSPLSGRTHSNRKVDSLPRPNAVSRCTRAT